MTSRIRRIAVLSMCAACVGSARADDSVEEVAEQIAKAAKGVKSFQADMKTVIEMSQEGYSMKSTTTGTYELVRQGDVFKSRLESKARSETTVAGNTSSTDVASLIINDGTHSYNLTDSGGMKQVFKSKASPEEADPIALFKQSNDLKVLPDESYEGRAVWVIEASPKNGGGMGGQGRSVMQFDKQTGQMLKMVAYMPDGSPMSTTTYSNIRVNESISADRFVWTTPPGVTVQEM